MFRIYALAILAFFLGGVFAMNMPAEAQQLFIKKSQGGAKEGEKTGKTKLFVAPKGHSSKSKKKSTVKYKDKLKLVQEIKFNKEQIKSYEYWQKSGRTPQTLEEKIAYAQARHSVQYGVMLQRKAQLIPALEKKLRNQPQHSGYQGVQADSAVSFEQAALKLQKNFDAYGFAVDVPKTEKAMAASQGSARGAFQPVESAADVTHSGWKKSGGVQQKTVKVKKKSVFNSGS